MLCVAGPSSLDLEASSGDKCPSVQSVPSVRPPAAVSRVCQVSRAPKADLSIEHQPLIIPTLPGVPGVSWGLSKYCVRHLWRLLNIELFGITKATY